MDDQCENISGNALTEVREHRPKRKFLCWSFTPSPYPIYIANTLYFIPMSINVVAFEAVLYNKLCYMKYENVSLCTNTSFTANHPQLQVSADK